MPRSTIQHMRTAAFLFVWIVVAAPSAAASPLWAPGRMLVKLRPQAAENYHALRKDVTVTPLHSYEYLHGDMKARVVPLGMERSPGAGMAVAGLRGLMLVSGLPADTDIPALAREMQQRFGDEIAYAEPDYIGHGAAVPDDPKYRQQWGAARIGMPEAWDYSTGSADIIVGHLDSGVAMEHPDLAGALLDGYDFANGDASPEDDHGHGTNTAGIIVARMNNDIGIAGICPTCSLIPLKVLDAENTGYYSWWIAGIDYGISHGVRLFNMSLGGTADSQALHDAIVAAKNAGIPVVACMMNADSDTPYYPAAYDETIAVGAIDSEDARAQFPTWGSNYGPHIDIVAPGAGIIGPANDGSGYELWSGTSQAAPHVAGVIGLMLSMRPDLSVGSILNILRSTADDRIGPSTEDTPGWDQYFGYGLLDAPAALEQVTQVPADGDYDTVDTDRVDGDDSAADSGESSSSDSGCRAGHGLWGMLLLLLLAGLRRSKQRLKFHA